MLAQLYGVLDLHGAAGGPLLAQTWSHVAPGIRACSEKPWKVWVSLSAMVSIEIDGAKTTRLQFICTADVVVAACTLVHVSIKST